MTTSIREALTAALEAAPVETPVETVETVSPVEAVSLSVETVETAEAKTERDEKGRFAAKTAEVASEAAQPVTRKPPSSWKKDYWDRWGKLDTETQDYIEQRESEAARGVSTYKQQWDQVAPIHQALQPFMPTLQQRGITPDRWLQDLGHVDRVLSTGTLAEKTQLIQQMAARNGVQLNPQEQGDPNLNYLLQTVNGLQSKVQAFESTAAQRDAAVLQSEIKQFAADKPHFEAVRPTMGKLLQSGVADTLQTAYDKAIRLHDDVWQEHQASQAAEAQAKRDAEIAKKKAAASSPRSASPTGAVAAVNGKKSLRETLTDAVDSVVGGRV